MAQRDIVAGRADASGRGSSFARVREGRIVEIRVLSLVDLDDLAAFCANTGSTIREAGPRAIVCADHRAATPLAGEIADEWSRRIRQGNPAHAKTSAVLLDPGNALYNLQVARVMQCAGKHVRLFTDVGELTGWLAAVLTDGEAATVREIFRESSTQRDPERPCGREPRNGDGRA
jgi:hypothetical protein